MERHDEGVSRGRGEDHHKGEDGKRKEGEGESQTRRGIICSLGTRLYLGFSISISVTERAGRQGSEKKKNLRDAFHVGLL